MEAYVFDVTNGLELPGSRLVLPAQSSPIDQALMQFNVPVTTAITELRFTNTHATNTPTFKFDDVIATDEPFQYKNLTETASVRAEGNAGTVITPNVTNIDWTEVIDTHGAWSGTQYKVQNSESIISISFSVFYTNTISSGIDMYKNGVVYERITQETSDSVHTKTYVSISGEFAKDDLISFRAYRSGTLISGAPNLHYLNINETWETANVITPITDQVTRFVGTGIPNQAITAGVTDVPYVASVDEANAWNGSQYVVPYDSDISITGLLTINVINRNVVSLYVNGVVYKEIGAGSQALWQAPFAVHEKFTKGQILSIRVDQGGNILASAPTIFNHIEITARNVNAIVLGALPVVSSGSSVGSSSIYKLLNAETDLSDFVLTGSGSMAAENVTPHSGTQSYKFIPTATGDRATATIPLQNRNKGKENSVSFTYEATSAGMDVVVYDLTNTVELDRLSLPATSSVQNGLLQFFTKDATDNITFFLEDVGATHPTVTIDDIEFSDDPLQYKNLTETASVRAEGNAGTVLTGGVTDIDFTEVTDTHGAWNGTQYIVQNSNSVINLKLSMFITSVTNNTIDLYVNNVYYKRIQNIITDSVHQGSYIFSKGEFNKGDVLSFRAIFGATLSSVSNLHYLNINETWETTNVITPFKTNMTDSKVISSPSVTGTGGGTLNAGTGSSYTVTQSRSGQYATLRYTLRVGAGVVEPTGAYIFSFPTNLTIDLNGASYYIVGNGTITNTLNAASVANLTAKTWGAGGFILDVDNGTSPATLSSGDGLLNNSNNIVDITIRVPIVGWSSDAIAMGALPIKRGAILNPTTINQFQSSITSTTSYKTQTISEVDSMSDSSFVSVLNNQFTLQKGRYLSNIPIGTNANTSWLDLQLFNITDSIIYKQITQVVYNIQVYSVPFSTIPIIIDIPSTKIFEIRTRSGIAAGFEYLGKVTIEKIK